MDEGALVGAWLAAVDIVPTKALVGGMSSGRDIVPMKALAVAWVVWTSPPRRPW